MTPVGVPITCPVCKSKDTTIHYEHLCPNGWTHWWTDSRNVGPDPADGTRPASMKCPGCGFLVPPPPPVPALFMECTICGEVTTF